MIYTYVRTANISKETSIINNYVQTNDILLNGVITDDISALKAINELQSGDTIIAVGIYSFVEKLDDIQSIIRLCCKKKIYIKTIDDAIDIDESFDFDQLLKSFDLTLRIRTSIMSKFAKVKLEARKYSGQKIGRAYGSKNINKKADPYKDKIIELASKGFSKVKIAKECGLSRQTVMKYIADHKELFEDFFNARKKRIKKVD